MKKILLGFFLAFSIFLFPRSVSAASSEPFNPAGGSVNINMSDDSFLTYKVRLENFMASYNLNSDDYYYFYANAGSNYTWIFPKDSATITFAYDGSTAVPVLYSDTWARSTLDRPISWETNDFSSFWTALKFQNGSYDITNIFLSSNVPTLAFPSGISPFAFISYINPPFESDFLTGFVTGFDYSTEAFVQWLIDTGKYQDLPAYIGTSKLVSFVDFYKQWGSSNKLFVIKILDWFAHFNIGAQTLENRNILKATIDRLYQEYCNSSYVVFKSNSSNQVHHRNNINTKTDDTDLTLVTDDPDDDTITSILRDILRGVIAIPTSIYNNSQAIIAKLDSLNWTVNIANDGGSSSGSDLTPVLDKMDDIIDALGSDTVSVEIDQTTKDDTDDFFDDWNLHFSTALNNKFPVASQLRTFFSGFFERCGIDADSDGEVYQYYNPSPLRAGSSSSSSEEETIVNDFLNNFGGADPSFLDDASFHGVPDLSVSVGGQSVSIIDFRVYAKYRDKIHFIISFVIWTLYLLHLYKALPSIIGQVADVATKTSDL